jgi:AAA+ ATPase superfamily predicted ATPase
MNIIGRASEKENLKYHYESWRPEFIVVYGRRRVGKTYLIKEFFQERFDFYATGAINADIKQQLHNFAERLQEHSRRSISEPENWFDAFRSLREYLEGLIAKDSKMRRVIFIDELPWFDTRKSGFVSALDYFWNSWASSRPQIMLIACGSATSWMMNKIILSTGGLHNRLTGRIALQPFTLAECKDYYEANGIVMSEYQMIEAYMIVGGIPYYLSLFRRKQSLAQNINRLCFKQGGELTSEFHVLYNSVFKEADVHMRVVKALSRKNKGMTRSEISTLTNIKKGGTLTRVLLELEQCGFIRRYNPFAKKTRGALYQLVDSFSLFYLNFMDSASANDDGFWLKFLEGGAHHAWAGYAFEQVCGWHIPQIKEALGISGIIANTSGWRSTNSDPGAQIDLVIDRYDGVINLCEMKYSNDEFEITKSYDKKLREKREAFRRETKTKKALHITMITSFGLLRNEYAGNIQSEVTGEDLFRKALLYP